LLELLSEGGPGTDDDDDDESIAPLRAMAAMARTAIGQNAELLRALPHAWNALGIEPALKMLDVAHRIIAEQRLELEKLRQERREQFETLERAKSEESDRMIAAALATQEIEQKQEVVDLLKREVPRIIAARAVDRHMGQMLSTLTEDQLAALAIFLTPEQLKQVRAVAETQRERFRPAASAEPVVEVQAEGEVTSGS
jgi:hypothetical protein